MAIIDAAGVSARVEQVALEDALGRRLAADIVADRDDPPFDKSLMDGFAVRAGDGATLRVVGEIAAGAEAGRGLVAGEAMAIMTGAPIPTGADAVVPIEQTRREGDMVHLQATARAGQSIGRRGGDCQTGAVLLNKGTQLFSPQIAVAASTGARRVSVFGRPRVAILSTGDEIVPIDRVPWGAEIRNTNSPMLRALLGALGCEVRDLGIVRDEPALIREKLEDGMQSDVLFVCGGMSMGEHDYVPRLLVEMGVEIRISKLRIKPGKPFVFGERGGRFVFGLPGNPVSGYVCTLRLASRLLVRMAGGRPVETLPTATLLKGVPENGPREFYQPGILDGIGGVEPLAWKGSADIYTLARANALIVREENALAAPFDTKTRYLPMM